MRLSLIGMSGSGKSHWSKKLAEEGFQRFCCDDLIAERLATSLRRPDGTSMSLGEWMGFPYASEYESREREYLEAEVQVLHDVIQELVRTPPAEHERVVVDTTGSVIYTGEALLDTLRRNTIVVHFAVPPAAREEMLRTYLGNPRPVLWRDLYRPEPGETAEAALARCYGELLRAREALYEKCAHVTVPYDLQKGESFRVADLLELVRHA